MNISSDYSKDSFSVVNCDNIRICRSGHISIALYRGFNMKITICLLLLCISTIAFSQENEAKFKNKLEPTASFSLNSNGFAPVPAFSLGKPAFIASVNITKGRFSYAPTLAYSLEMKPWFIDNWLQYKFIIKPEFVLRAGLNFSTFCSELTVNDDEILQAERYFAYALTGTYKFSPVSTITIDYWNDNGQEKESLRGHFINLAFDRSKIKLGKNILLSLNLMLFYINYDGNNDGFFVSPTILFSMKNIPSALILQASQAIQSNIVPWPGFKWNIGISYKL
jgi:hypothetical protein